MKHFWDNTSTESFATFLGHHWLMLVCLIIVYVMWVKADEQTGGSK